MSDAFFTAAASFAQDRLWVLDQLQSGGEYGMARAVRFRGALDAVALQRALEAVVARHESLRTTFRTENETLVQVVSSPSRVELPLVDLGEERSRLGALMEKEAALPFDLRNGPLFRATLYRMAHDEHVLLLLMHHVVSDAWSVELLLHELAVLYGDVTSGREASLPELPIQYADYAEWQRSWLEGDELDAQLDYWKRRLSGAPRVLELPTDHPRRPMETHAGAQHRFLIRRELYDRISEFAGREGVTPFMTVLAAFATLLWRYTGQEDLVVGTPVTNRNRTELEGVIGLFVNTLVMRTDLSGNPTVRKLVKRVRESCLGAYAHQDLPFESLVQELHVERDLSRNPLFQVMLAFQNASPHALAFAGLDVSPVEVERRAAQVDVALYVAEAPEGLRATFEYATDLFEAATMARMAGHFETLLSGMTENPDQPVATLPLLTAAEMEEQRRWNDTAAPVTAKCVHELVADQASRTPGRTAVEFGRETMTYGELDARSSRLCERLAARGAAPGVRVGLYMERSPDMVVAVLAIMKSGAAYVPLDPAFPADRLAFMLEDAQASIVVSSDAFASSVPSTAVPVVLVRAEEPSPATEAPGHIAAANLDAPAYLIYTSGSTGRPKGVVVSHRSLVNLLESVAREPGLGPADVLLSVTTLSFDIAALELYLPLILGGRVVLASRDEASDAALLQAKLAASRATVMQATPVTWRLLVQSGWAGDKQLKVLCGGEALPTELADSLSSRVGELWNMYGPTETTIWSSVGRVRPGTGPVSIGRPIANTQLWILDGGLQPLPVGVQGELYIGGMGLAIGYWNRPELTAERFVPDPFSSQAGARLYRTGDLARRHEDGTVECLGRIDNQVKIRGFRVELGEIESSLQRFPGVVQAVVVPQDAAGEIRLVAFVAAEQGVQSDTAAMRTTLGTWLPPFMVPAAFVFVDALPLTPNGKIDRKALAKAEVKVPGPASGRAVPRTTTEETVSAIWAEVLQVPSPGIHDNFFDVGGHSMSAARIINRLRSTFGLEVGLRVLFERPTVAGLAEAVDLLLLAKSTRRADHSAADREEFEV